MILSSATRLATAWRAVSRGVRAAGAGPGAMLEALANVAGALAARLYYAEGEGEFVAVADWCWAMAEGEAHTLSLALNPDAEGLLPAPSDLPPGNPAAWAVLPLPFGERIVGIVLLARPALPEEPDDTTREALVLAARQAGCVLAATRAQGLLDEATHFGAFHRALAFATHDIKGLSSQLALLASNTERLGDNPDFRADMLITLRAAAARLDALLARLAQGEGVPSAAPARQGADVGAIARAIAARLAPRHLVSVIEREPCAVLGDAAALEQLLTHLIDNAVEASAPQSPVFVGINADGAMVRLEVIDSGHGMSAQFVATRLFRPFDTAKPGGFGIGAYEAREMVRAMGGHLDVESREGVGTRFVIRLPRVAALASVVL